MMQVGLIQAATLILGGLAVVAHSWEHGHFDSSPASAGPPESNIFTVHNAIPYRQP